MRTQGIKSLFRWKRRLPTILKEASNTSSIENTLYLHVGMHKTGTTSIQNFFAKNRKKLLTHKLSYLNGPTPNHSLLILSLFEKEAWSNHGVHFRSKRDRKRYFGEDAMRANREGLEHSAKQAARSGLDAVVSGEAIYHLSQGGMANLRDFFLQYFDRIVIVGFVRSPIDFAQSYAQQSLKQRNTLVKMRSSPPKPNYEKRFAGFADIFGLENFVISPFEREIFPSRSSLKMFLRMIHAPEAEELLNEDGEDNKNVSMSMQAAKMLSFINNATHEMEFDEYRKRVVKPILELTGDPFQISAEMAERVLRQSTSDIEWLASNLGIRFDTENQKHLDRPSQEMYSIFSPEEIRNAMFSLINAKA